jgi:glycosyltransferase involved in cell wall biosynthesis
MKICMLAYAHYLNDARIKCYVKTLEDHGHQIDVIALRSDGELATQDLPTGTIFRIMSKYQGGSALMYAWSYLAFFVKAFFHLAGRTLRDRYDVVHVHNMPNVLVFAALVPKMFGARVLLDIHDLMTVNYMAKFGAKENDLRVRILRWEQRLSSLAADAVICADHNQRDYLAAHCGIPEQKISVLMNLPNTNVFGPMAPVRRRREKNFRIVYHGTIARRLGIDLIVQAMARVVDQVQAELWIYGTGDYLPEVLALAAQLGIEDNVHFSRSFFPVEQIPEIVSGMDLGIIGNRRNLACDRYMLPVKLLEYVYLGIPVVAPRLEVIARYFDDQMVCFYDPENVEQMANAIVGLCCDAEECERQARAALRFYAKHQVEAQGERYLELVGAGQVKLDPVPEQFV